MSKLKQLLGSLKPRHSKATVSQDTPKAHTDIKSEIGNYYKQARGWQYDVFDSVVISRDRYRKGCIGLGVLLGLSLACTFSMLPMRSVVPVVIHHDVDGASYVTTGDFVKHFRQSPAQIKSDIFHYVKKFEGFSATSFELNNKYMQAMSSAHVYALYTQHVHNLDLVDKLKQKGYRKVDVQYINLVQAKNSLNGRNQAIVTFKVIDSLYTGKVLDEHSYQAVVNWTYQGLPKTKTQAFINFDGFTVTGYQVTSLNYQGNSNE